MGPHFADMELHTPSPMDQDAGVPLGELRRAAARSDAAAEASPSDEELLPGTPPASGRGRRRLDMDGGAAAAAPLGREGAPEEPGEEPPAPPPVPAADGEARRVRRRVTQAGRLFCPVPGCPCADSGSAAGWASLQSLVGHVNVHLSGVLQGTVPAEWMQEHGRARCRVCGLCVAAGRGVHPTCRPAERAQAPGGTGSDDAAADQDVLPPLEEVMAQHARTAKHVPKACRDQWARALTRALAAVVAYNTTAAWTELIMLPKAVLGPPPRGGRKNTRAAATFTADRLSRWLDGDKHELWREVCASPAPARPGPATAAHNRRRAEALAREGFDRKACAALLSKGVCEDTAQVVETLRQLHPQAPHPVCPPLAELPLAADITASSVERVLRTFPRDSAAGPSGTRVQHFVEALTPGHCTPVLEQLTAVVQLLARGGAPPDVAPYLAGASLMALPKESGGIRPIAVGEVLRRITGKCLCAAVREEAHAFFPPAQLGVACPSGVDAAVHAARAWTTRSRGDASKGLLKLDFKNAFNTVDRARALGASRERFPGVARWAQWVYARPAKLFFGEHILASAAGVQQGDPLGPLLFAATIQPMLERLKAFEANGVKLELVAFYLDDGFLAGDLRVVAAALESVRAECVELGLELNIGKCELVLPPDVTCLQDDLVPLFPQALLVQAASGESRVSADGNFELLGAAVGNERFSEEFAARKVANAAALLQELPAFEDPQVAVRLMRSCAGPCKLTHIMRMTPPRLHMEALRRFDDDMRTTFSKVTGLAPGDPEWHQACRGVGHAGLGMRRAGLHAPAAFIASVGSSGPLARALDAAYLQRGDADMLEVDAALGVLNAELPPERRFAREAALAARQQQMSRAIDDAGHAARLADAVTPVRAQLLSECEPGARAFWHAPPSHVLGLAVRGPEFVEEVRARLCIQECASDRWCPLCDCVADTRGFHARMCAAGGDRTLRHNAVRNFVFQFARAAGLHPELERVGLLPDEPGRGQAQRRPADVFLPAWSSGSPAALDFAVVSPQRQESIDRAAQTPLTAASDYTETKRVHLHTAAACREAGIDFVPMVVESSGAWASEASAVLWQLAAASAARSGKHTADLYQELLQGAAVRIRRANARAALRRAAVQVAPAACADQAAWAELAAAAGGA